MRVSPKLLGCRSMPNRLNKKLRRIVSLQPPTLYFPSPHVLQCPPHPLPSLCGQKCLPVSFTYSTLLSERSRQKSGFVSICARQSRKRGGEVKLEFSDRSGSFKTVCLFIWSSTPKTKIRVLTSGCQAAHTARSGGPVHQGCQGDYRRHHQGMYAIQGSWPPREIFKYKNQHD